MRDHEPTPALDWRQDPTFMPPTIYVVRAPNGDIVSEQNSTVGVPYQRIDLARSDMRESPTFWTLTGIVIGLCAAIGVFAVTVLWWGV
jgi:hypothetical protein